MKIIRNCLSSNVDNALTNVLWKTTFCAPIQTAMHSIGKIKQLLENLSLFFLKKKRKEKRQKKNKLTG
jgi:hypothetical protein